MILNYTTGEPVIGMEYQPEYDNFGKPKPLGFAALSDDGAAPKVCGVIHAPTGTRKPEGIRLPPEFLAASKAKGFSYRSLALVVGSHPTTVHKWLTGFHRVTHAQAAKLAEILGIEWGEVQQ